MAKAWLAAQDGPVATWITSFAKEMIELHRSHRTLYRAMLPLVAPLRRHRRVRQAVGEVRQALRVRLEERPDELRKRDLDLATFVAGHAFEACLHAAIDERPELLDDPRFTEELVDLVSRYMLRDERT